MTEVPLFLTSLREVKVNKLAWQGTKHARTGMKLHRQACLINTQGCITHALTLTHRSVIRGLGVFWLFVLFFALSHLTYRFCIFCGSSPSKKKKKKEQNTLEPSHDFKKKKAHNFKKTLTQDLMIENYISLGSHKSTSRLRKGDLQMTSANLVSHIFSHIRFSEE